MSGHGETASIRGDGPGYALLDAAQRRVAHRLLAAEEEQRRHLVVSLSGAHAYGFPSPDSDLDLKAIHVEPTSRLLGLSPPPLAADRQEVKGGIELDYTSNELGEALKGILTGNGNYLERVLGETALFSSPKLESLRPLAARSLSRRVHRHYAGFARNQLEQARATPAAKKCLYVLRTALTGTHLLRTGELVVDLTRLLDRYEFGHARELIEAKRRGERVELGTRERDRWLSEAERALALLEPARAESVLPEEAPNRAELEAWLLDVRRSSWRWPTSPAHA